MRLLWFNLATDVDDPVLGFTSRWIQAIATKVERIHVITMRAGRIELPENVRCGCLRCLLLAMCTYPFAKKALTLHLPCGEGRERYFGCNLMQRKVLASSHQHLMAEAP